VSAINVFGLLLATTLGGTTVMCAADSRSAEPTLYERIEAKLKRNPELAAQLGQPPSELGQVKWMIGTWEIESHVFATATTAESTSRGTSIIAPVLGGTWLSISDSYPSGTQDLGYLGYETSTGRWVALSLDSTPGAHITYAEEWQNNRLVFEGAPIRILGEEVVLRQTLEKRGDREYRIINEERLDKVGWVAVDEYVYRKK
jgi:hypothetical protein